MHGVEDQGTVGMKIIAKPSQSSASAQGINTCSCVSEGVCTRSAAIEEMTGEGGRLFACF